MTHRSELSFEEDYRVTVVGRNIEITKPIEDYILEKIAKIEKFSHHKIEAVVRVDVQKVDHRVDVIFKFSHFKIAVHAVTENLYASIDKAFDRLKGKMLKWKGRIQAHHGKHLSTVDMEVNVLAHQQDDLESINEAIEEERIAEMAASFAPPRVAKKKTIVLKSLTLDEAVMKMSLSGDHFMVYRSEEDRKLKVIYLRRDGSYGVISPE